MEYNNGPLKGSDKHVRPCDTHTMSFVYKAPTVVRSLVDQPVEHASRRKDIILHSGT